MVVGIHERCQSDGEACCLKADDDVEISEQEARADANI
eukprot:CAMPEP_0174728528 /NCGR_PEP_ID=MMETSP1094-20130205/51896_1 /TAXON_ID=156173 /ORGANISM="Chrysochromulina brevifilum, Strain UTEX LB 985" /LENGTH=37 /DNA_ID= /DNA_START= /DNA_END= /DNA_ORIENTATION=